MRNTLEQAAQKLIACFQQGNKLLLCGNGGSAADCGHIAGELCKGFLSRRTPDQDFVTSIGEGWAANLQQGLPAIDLTAQSPLITAIINDISGEDIFAQQGGCAAGPHHLRQRGECAPGCFGGESPGDGCYRYDGANGW